MAEGFVKIRSFWSPDEANLARMHLESCGIPAELEGSNMVATAWIDANAIGGVKLLVNQADAAEAEKLLDQRSTEDAAADSSEYLEFANDYPENDDRVSAELRGSDENSAPGQGILSNFRSMKGPLIWAYLLFPLLVAIASFLAGL